MPLTKKTILTAVGFFAILGTVFAEIDVSKFKAPKTYKGKVVSLCTTNVKMGIDQTFKGEVIFVQTAGTFFTGPVITEEGEIIRRGTVLAKLDGKTLKANLEQKKAAMDTKASNYRRNMEILKKAGKGAISEQAMLEAKNEYLVAKSEVIIAEELLGTTTYRARFDGRVTKMLFPGGYTTEADRDVLEVEQLVPIGIEIQMDRTEAFKYGSNTPIGIIPLGSKKAYGPYRGLTSVYGSGVIFIMANYRQIDKTHLVDGKDVPVVTYISPVIPFELNEKINGKFFLGVNVDCIQKDAKGTFVFIAAGQKMTQAINPVFKLEKIYIKTADEINPVESSVRYIKIQDPGKLAMSDTVLATDETKGMKDGDTVYFQNTGYIFMPGDHVDVIVDTSVLGEQTL